MKDSIRDLGDQMRRLERPAADGIFALLLFAVVIGAGWLVARNDRLWDWTESGSNTLSPQSAAIVERLQGPLAATVFADARTPLAKAVGQLLARYEQVLPGMEIRFRDPQLFPEQARDAGVSLFGQVMLEYRGRRETVKELSERSVTAAIARLTETRNPWIAVIEGHGERAIDGERAADLGRLGAEMADQGLLARPVDLARAKDVPDNARLIILSNPRLPLFEGEIEGLVRFLDRGGNLLWLMDPGALNGLEPLAAALGLTPLPGVVVDAAAAQFGVETPAVAVVSEYPGSPIFDGLSQPAIMPGALAFEPSAAPGWTLETFLATGKKSWNETGGTVGSVTRDEVVGELAGPLPVLLALTRSPPDSEVTQRVMVVGDGDFLSNAQLASYGNRALSTRILGWLSNDEGLSDLPPPPGEARPLELTPSRQTLVAVSVLMLLPGAFVVAGLLIRWHRWREG